VLEHVEGADQVEVLPFRYLAGIALAKDDVSADAPPRELESFAVQLDTDDL
jgi:hypothetical protein